jgi:hypothetical protein
MCVYQPKTTKKEDVLMDPQQMADWAYSHACDKCHSGEECKMDECLNASEVSDFLKRMERFEGKGADGASVRGWFIRDQV